MATQSKMLDSARPAKVSEGFFQGQRDLRVDPGAQVAAPTGGATNEDRIPLAEPERGDNPIIETDFTEMKDGTLGEQAIKSESNGSHPAIGAQIPAPKERKGADQSPQSTVDDALPQRTKRGGGPRTSLGKQRSRGNAVKHGILAKVVLVPGESEAEYLSLRRGLRKDHKPQGMHQELLVDLIAAALWGLRQVFIAKTAEVQKGRDFREWDEKREQVDQATRILDACEDFGGLMRNIANPEILEECLSLLGILKDHIKRRGFDEKNDRTILAKLFGEHNPESASKTLFNTYLYCLNGTGSGANVGEQKERSSPEDFKSMFLHLLERQIRELDVYKKKQNLIDSKRRQVESLCASVPDGVRLDRLLRYETSLVRQLAFAQDALERSQKNQSTTIIPVRSIKMPNVN